MQYEDTRHNLGFMVIDELSGRNGISMGKQRLVKGILGKGKIGSCECLLLKPMTFMNESGYAVALVQRYYRVPLGKILVISDEIALPYGKLRFSAKGSCGGHRGLRSIEMRLGRDYARLRIGVGDRQEGDLVDHVLGKFQGEELANLPTVIKQAAVVAEGWVLKQLNYKEP